MPTSFPNSEFIPGASRPRPFPIPRFADSAARKAFFRSSASSTPLPGTFVTKVPGNGVDDALDRKNALRAAESAKRGIGNGLGLDAPGMNSEFGKEVGIVGVKHGAVHHANAEIG